MLRECGVQDVPVLFQSSPIENVYWIPPENVVCRANSLVSVQSNRNWFIGNGQELWCVGRLVLLQSCPKGTGL